MAVLAGDLALRQSCRACATNPLTDTQCLQSFYYDGKPAMTDEEFDMLKDELVWSGSRVAVLRQVAASPAAAAAGRGGRAFLPS